MRVSHIVTFVVIIFTCISCINPRIQGPSTTRIPVTDVIETSDLDFTVPAPSPANSLAQAVLAEALPYLTELARIFHTPDTLITITYTFHVDENHEDVVIAIRKTSLSKTQVVGSQPSWPFIRREDDGNSRTPSR